MSTYDDAGTLYDTKDLTYYGTVYSYTTEAASAMSAFTNGADWPVNVYVNGRAISHYVSWDLGTFSWAESGGTEPGQAQATILDKNLALQTYITDEAYLRIQRAGIDTFRGFIRSRSPRATTTGATYALTCTDIGSILDQTIVVSNTRPAGEADSTRIKYFLSAYLKDAHFSSDVSQIRTLNSNMPAQSFSQLTLRQAIERVLGAASPSSKYYVDASGRLHTFDSGHPESNAAPYAIVVTPLPSAGQAAPMALQVDFDTNSLINLVYIRGKTAGGSGYFPTAGDSDFNQAVTSQNLYGIRQAYQDGPDSDTAAKAKALALAVFADNAFPVTRGQFSLVTPFDQRNGTYWHGGQTVTITSAMHGLTAQPFLVTKVTTTIINGQGNAKVDIEFGGLSLRLRAGGTTNTVGTSITGDIAS